MSAAADSLRASIRLPGLGWSSSALEVDLQPLRVFRTDARIEVHGDAGVRHLGAPSRRYFSAAPAEGGLVVVSLDADRRIHGWLDTPRGRFELHGTVSPDGAAPTFLAASPVAELLPPLEAQDECAADRAPELDGPTSKAGDAILPLPSFSRLALEADSLRASGPPEPANVATVAIETDYELYLAMGSTVEGVVEHVGDTMAVAAATYDRDVDTGLRIGYLAIWETDADPYAVQGGFLDALYELGDVWHANHPTLPRALVHFMSGKSGIAGGIGYHGVLCLADAPVSGHWGGGYSLSGSHGSFGAQRDIFVVSHEIGHNFRAYHTHCFNDLPNSGDPPIDLCYSGDTRNDGHACYAGPTSLPPDGGSIMSYCHLLGGGYSNIHFSLGEAGAYGTASERVVNRMVAHVQSVSCLVPDDLFVDGFASGTTAAWSSTPLLTPDLPYERPHP